MKSVFPTEESCNVKCAEELDFFCIGFQRINILLPEFPNFSTKCGKNCCSAPKPCPPKIELDGESVWTIFMKIEKQGMNWWMVEEGPIPGHPVVNMKWKSFFPQTDFSIVEYTKCFS